MSITCFIEPVDVLYLRGNRLFGSPGDHGEALMPPWPSMASGAIRSHVLTACGADFQAFKCGDTALYSNEVQQALGTYDNPGDFRITWFSPARVDDGTAQPLLPKPEDVVILKDKERQKLQLHHLQPVSLPEGVAGSAPLSQVALLKTDTRAKPEGSYWLNTAGIEAWVRGELLDVDKHFAKPSEELWKLDSRLGIARDPDTRTAAEGQIYTTETVAFVQGLATQPQCGGFLVGISGLAQDALQADGGLLRLGGDGRAARLQPADWQPPAPDWGAIERAKACRIMLTTPGLFVDGWRLPGMDEQGNWQLPDGSLKGRVVAAAVPRGRTVSGWDLARWEPKAAQRSVPTGAVYWLEELQGDIEGGLQRLLAEGLWAAMADDDIETLGKQRRAEGFNNCLIGAPVNKVN